MQISRAGLLKALEPGEQIAFPAYAGASKWMRGVTREIANIKDRKYTMQAIIGVATATREVVELVLVTRVE